MNNFPRQDSDAPSLASMLSTAKGKMLMYDMWERPSILGSDTRYSLSQSNIKTSRDVWREGISSQRSRDKPENRLSRSYTMESETHRGDMSMSDYLKDLGALRGFTASNNMQAASGLPVPENCSSQDNKLYAARQILDGLQGSGNSSVYRESRLPPENYTHQDNELHAARQILDRLLDYGKSSDFRESRSNSGVTTSHENLRGSDGYGRGRYSRPMNANPSSSSDALLSLLEIINTQGQSTLLSSNSQSQPSSSKITESRESLLEDLKLLQLLKSSQLPRPSQPTKTSIPDKDVRSFWETVSQQLRNDQLKYKSGINELKHTSELAECENKKKVIVGYQQKDNMHQFPSWSDVTLRKEKSRVPPSPPRISGTQTRFRSKSPQRNSVPGALRFRSRSPRRNSSPGGCRFHSRSPQRNNSPGYRKCGSKSPTRLRRPTSRSPKRFRSRSPMRYKRSASRSPKQNFSRGRSGRYRSRTPTLYRSRSPAFMARPVAKDHLDTISHRSRTPPSYRCRSPAFVDRPVAMNHLDTIYHRSRTPPSYRSRSSISLERSVPINHLDTTSPYKLIGALRLVESALSKASTPYILQVIHCDVSENVFYMPHALKSAMFHDGFELRLGVVPGARAADWKAPLHNLLDFAFESNLDFDVFVQARAHDDEMDIRNAKPYELAEYFRGSNVIIAVVPLEVWKDRVSESGKKKKKKKGNSTLIAHPPGCAPPRTEDRLHSQCQAGGIHNRLGPKPLNSRHGGPVPSEDEVVDLERDEKCGHKNIQGRVGEQVRTKGMALKKDERRKHKSIQSRLGEQDSKVVDLESDDRHVQKTLLGRFGERVDLDVPVIDIDSD